MQGRFGIDTKVDIRPTSGAVFSEPRYSGSLLRGSIEIIAIPVTLVAM